MTFSQSSRILLATIRFFMGSMVLVHTLSFLWLAIWASMTPFLQFLIAKWFQTYRKDFNEPGVIASYPKDI